MHFQTNSTTGGLRTTAANDRGSGGNRPPLLSISDCEEWTRIGLPVEGNRIPVAQKNKGGRRYLPSDNLPIALVRFEFRSSKREAQLRLPINRATLL